MIFKQNRCSLFFCGSHDCTVSYSKCLLETAHEAHIYIHCHIQYIHICTYRIRSGPLISDDEVEPGDGGERVQDEGGKQVFMKSDSLAAQTPAQTTTNHVHCQTKPSEQ